MKKYKGFAGNKVLIQGERVQIKQMLRTEGCYIDDIIQVKLIEPKNYGNGKIIITTKNADNEIHFTEKQLDTFKELYEYINENSEGIKQHTEKTASFKATKKIGKYFYIDEKNEKWAIPILSLFRQVKELRIFNYDEIKGYELIENNNVISKGSVGELSIDINVNEDSSEICNDLKIIIEMNNKEIPTITILFLNVKVKKTSDLYQKLNGFAHEIAHLLNMIVNKETTRLEALVIEEENKRLELERLAEENKMLAELEEENSEENEEIVLEKNEKEETKEETKE